MKMNDLALHSDLMENAEDSSDSDIYDCNETSGLLNRDSICETVVLREQYMLHLDATSESDPKVAVASENNCEIIKLCDEQITTITSFKEHKDQIIDCRFDKRDCNLVYVGYTNCGIKLWDLRTPKQPAITFFDETVKSGKSKTFSCFDVSSNGRLLTAGMELFEGDAFLLFWDTRSNKQLGGYWESHTDDITQVRFHPEDKDNLISGSTDGLINIYDLSRQCEEDALLSSLNTLSSVDQLMWFNENLKSNIGCITHTSDLQLWSIDGVEAYKLLTRSDIARDIKKKSDKYVYAANIHDAVGSLLLLVGSNYGDGECLRCLQMKCGKVECAYNFNGNKQRVRCSWFHPHKNVLLTGGENGILNLWNLK